MRFQPAERLPLDEGEDREHRHHPFDLVLHLSAVIICAYVTRNTIAARDLPNMIMSVHTAIKNVSIGSVPERRHLQDIIPAVPITKSITDDYIICLEDGGKFRSLVRHLRTSYEMTPEQYRLKWSLPKNYPMTAPGYSRMRSSIAKKLGLGRKAIDQA